MDRVTGIYGGDCPLQFRSPLPSRVIRLGRTPMLTSNLVGSGLRDYQ